ncbi:hypothetical protein ACNAW0_19595 [Micromonospora sp. SL1-18]|uniref:hypothetical protein n=1 Tax=Micromonospora sp. SL1-18 TaxID=3399128 RepID=UPI003A4DDF36
MPQRRHVATWTRPGNAAWRRIAAQVADAFCASRLGDDHGHAFGALPAGVDFTAILSRAKVG